ncbi:putative e3 ubiquitin-protein ligase complex slx8-rfp subunit slx8 [Rosellinia necatrix]|uniref:Putative e3 ubiquitin-protein ligase complex slx8-rfp subunit slx8 n=1 Tax=Rosellinia necatrix TaxID=77044 RepID=A0A1W2TRN7_ROSNE|nr:putative e3 ubiquitin-protein ligase complex slx8-rfp subunit slx8 [Rosellinia necatrix]
MATWGGSSRDGGIVPDNCRPRNYTTGIDTTAAAHHYHHHHSHQHHANPGNAADTDYANITLHPVSSLSFNTNIANFNINIANPNTNPNASASASADTDGTANTAAITAANAAANANANTDIDNLSAAAAAAATAHNTGYAHPFAALGNPSPRHFIHTNPGHYSCPPLSSPPTHDSFYPALAGATLSRPFCATPNPVSLPSLLDVGGIFHSALFPPSREPLPTSPVQAQTQGQPQAQAQQQAQQQALAPAYRDQDPSFSAAGQFVPHLGGYHSYEPARGFPFRTLPNFPGSRPNLYAFASPSLSPFPTTPTTPTALSQIHMNNPNPQPNPPASQALTLPPLPRITEPARGIDDFFLTALATQDFTSPSLPPLSDPSSPSSLSIASRSKVVASDQGMPPSSTRGRIANRGGAVDLTKEEPDLEAPHSGIDSSIPFATMPATTRRRSITSGADPSGRKRRPSAVTSPSSRPSKARRKEPPIHGGDETSPFDDSAELDGHDIFETIDLSDATEVPPQLMAPKVDTRVKIGKFQCVICMDDTTALTVTHCGHLFCSECLHSSLHIDSMKRTCPVCRSKVDLREKKGKTIKSYYPLELKVMTATKKGKRPAGT